jgi:hypothetical protein
MTTKDFQALLAKETGYKIGVRQLTGSMKDYIRFKPLKSGGIYPEYTKEHITFCKPYKGYLSDYSFDLHKSNFQ